MLRFSQWRAGHLLLGWCAYWLALVLAALGSAMPSIMRVSKLPEGLGHASVSFGDQGLQGVITEGSSQLWSLDVSFLGLIFLIGVPPLVLWALWLRVHKRETIESRDAAQV